MPSSNPIPRLSGWASQNPRRATVIVLIIVMLIWTGQTYIWNPFFTVGYQYYPFVVLVTAGVLGKLLPHRKRTKKQDLEHIVQEIKATPPPAYTDPSLPPIGSFFCKCGMLLNSVMRPNTENGLLRLVCTSCGESNLYSLSDARPIPHSDPITPGQQTRSDPGQPPPLESLRDDDEA